MKKEQVVGVLGLITDGKEKVLLTLRHEPEQKKAHNVWQIPGGGVEFGEKPIETLKREMKEELDVEVEPLILVPYTNSSIWKTKNTTTHVVLLCFLCKVKKGKIKVDGIENKEYRWFKPDEISKLPTMPLAKEFIQAAEKIIRVDRKRI